MATRSQVSPGSPARTGIGRRGTRHPAVANAAGPAVTHAAGPAVTHAGGPAVTHAAGPAVTHAAGPAVTHAAGPAVTHAAGPAQYRHDLHPPPGVPVLRHHRREAD